MVQGTSPQMTAVFSTSDLESVDQASRLVQSRQDGSAHDKYVQDQSSASEKLCLALFEFRAHHGLETDGGAQASRQ